MIKRVEIILTESEICNIIRIALGISEKELESCELYTENPSGNIKARIIYNESK